MAYVRVDDGAMSHPKILGLSDRAFRLWIWGLCYAQMHLTDGYLPLAAIPPKLKAAAPLLMAPHKVLWEVADQGFQIHDYGDWNDVKATVQKNRKAAQARMQKRRASDEVPSVGSVENIPPVRSRTFAPNVPVRKSVSSSSEELEKETLRARAGTLLQDDYPAWYRKFRNGAVLRLMGNSLELDAAISVVKLWDDARIAKLAEVFLTTDETWISSTDRNIRLFATRASWCDDRLKQAGV